VPIPFLTELFDLINKHGVGPVLLVFIVVIGGLGWREWRKTRNKIEESEANARNKASDAEAESLIKLAQSLREMAESNNALVRLNIEDMRNGQSHRDKMFATMTELLGQMKGINLAQGDEGKARARMLTALHEIDEKINPLRTDIHEMSVRTAGLEVGVIKAFDDRFGPLMALIIGISTQVNALAAAAQTHGQNTDVIIQEAAKINGQLATIVSEFGLLKDMIFDRDDRIGDILKTFGSKEIS
jgi:seryl-tRNA synthetase